MLDFAYFTPIVHIEQKNKLAHHTVPKNGGIDISGHTRHNGGSFNNFEEKYASWNLNGQRQRLG